MKKLLVTLFTMLMLISLLTACSSDATKESPKDKATNIEEKDDVTEQKAEQTEKQDSDLLSAPATTLKTDTLDIYFDMEMSNGSRLKGSIIIIDNTSPARLYYSVGDEEFIYELADDGTIIKQIPNGAHGFTQDTETSQEDLKKETDSIINILTNCGWKFTEQNPDLLYRPIDAPSTGNAIVYGGSDSTWYELVKDGNVVGMIAVDNQTGIFNYAQSSEFYFATITAETENVSIP